MSRIWCGGGEVLLAGYLAALDRGGYCTGEGWGGGGVGGGKAGRGKMFGGVNPWCSSEEACPPKKPTPLYKILTFDSLVQGLANYIDAKPKQNVVI
jgi:hypothetical protein